jgi:signal transduction histidine kinase
MAWRPRRAGATSRQGESAGDDASPFMTQMSEHDNETARLLNAGRLVRAVAHNLRQPLMALEMNLATILTLTKREHIDGVLISEAIEDAIQSGRQMAASLRALEDLALPRQRPPQAIDLTAVVLDVVRLVGENGAAPHIRIEANVAPDLPGLIGEPAMIREAVLSLTLSAVDQVTATSSIDESSPAEGQPVQPRIIVGALRDDAEHAAIVVRHEAVRARQEPLADRMPWDATLARGVATLHGGTLTIETDALGGRAIMRIPTGGH